MCVSCHHVGSQPEGCKRLQGGASGQCVCICQPTQSSPTYQNSPNLQTSPASQQSGNSGSQQDGSSSLQQDSASLQSSPVRSGGLINANVGGSGGGGTSNFGTLGQSPSHIYFLEPFPGPQHKCCLHGSKEASKLCRVLCMSMLSFLHVTHRCMASYSMGSRRACGLTIKWHGREWA